MFSDFMVSFDRFEVRVARFGFCRLLSVRLRLGLRICEFFIQFRSF